MSDIRLLVVIKGTTDARSLGSRAFSMLRDADLAVCVQGNQRRVVKARDGELRSITKRELDELKARAERVEEVKA